MVKPSNRIYGGGGDGETYQMKVGANATTAKMVAGRLVIPDTNDFEVKEAGDEADDVMGVIEVGPIDVKTTTHAAGEYIRVIPLKAGTRVVLTLISGDGASVMGTTLVAAADGKAKKQAVGAMGSQGTPVAKVLLAADSTAADVEVFVELLSTAEAKAAA